jgi:hypothetical protein
MTAENRRKEEQPKAKTENSEESFVLFPNSTMADKTEQEQTFLPSGNIPMMKIVRTRSQESPYVRWCERTRAPETGLLLDAAYFALRAKYA